MTKRTVWLATGAVVCAILAVGIGWQLQASWDSQPVDLASLTLEQWRDDLHYMARELAKRHANAFHHVSRDQYWRLVARIDSALPALAATDIPVYFEKLTAAVGDAHTYVSLPDDQHFYPFAIYYFEDTARVIRAAPPFQRLLGTRLAKVGDLSTSQVEARLNEILTQGENAWFYRAEYPGFLSREVLHALGVLRDSQQAVFTFARADGSTDSVAMLRAPRTRKTGFFRTRLRLSISSMLRTISGSQRCRLRIRSTSPSIAIVIWGPTQQRCSVTSTLVSSIV